MTGPGHNGGPSLEPGRAWRRHCWREARAVLLPRLPVEIVRLRVKRAATIGLDYRTYAGVRAATGEDIVALLFSSNALRVLREGEAMDAARLSRLQKTRDISRLLAVHLPLSPDRLRATLQDRGIAVDHAGTAPVFGQTWGKLRSEMLTLLKPCRHPADRVLLVGDTAWEREWAQAGRLAGFLPSDRYFGESGRAGGDVGHGAGQGA